jgi:lysophospholipase
MAAFDRFGTASTHDGHRIRWAVRTPDRARGSVLLLGGRTEFIEKYEETAGELAGRGFAVLTLDWRGQGGSSRLLTNGHKGHVARFEDYLADLDRFLEGAARPFRTAPLLLLGHSMGGHIGLRCLLEHPRRFDGAVLTAPMLGIHLHPAVQGLLAGVSRAAVAAGYGDRYVPGTGDLGPRDVRFDGNPLTSDRLRFERNAGYLTRRPTLALGGVTFGWLDAAFRSIAALRTSDRIASNRCPIMIVCAGGDRVVSVRSQFEFRRRCPACGIETIAGSRHEILMESDAVRRRFWSAFDRFTAVL